ncbi:hypothetical protein FLONG3_4680 [Fusarium longipes]|uniref:BZIP transcription factor n=1 Tax=Fusarium longipes TaxID=694270 RepID=A0A395SYW3_9HYPO|nr:hypothetical protein FLONG3_4680 [Fusarium longipes]
MYSETSPATAEARRLKKRELDRKAQRLARERTKSRIAQLESMVDNLRQSDSNAQMSTLMDELSKVTKERDSLLQVLDSLGSTIRRHLGDSNTNEPSPDIKSEASSQATPRAYVPAEPSSSTLPIGTTRATSETSGSSIMELPIDTPANHPFAYNSWTFPVSNDPYPASMAFDNSILPQSGQGFMPIQPLLPNLPTPAPEDDDVIVPKASGLCHCSNPTSCGSNYHGVKPNIWRVINETLQKPAKLSTEEMAVEEYNAEDMPIRAIIEGWDSLERAGKMTPTWRKLRVADEMCFATCGNVERLAAMRICHLLLTYHGEPTLARRSTLPRWYLNRPSQALPHSYAIDFFVWPGLRERLIFSQHQYCTNTFWDLLQSNFKILWSETFQDTFFHNAQTGKYHISPMFEQRIRDINAWTMSTDFFTHFPELTEDIPTFMGIPPSMAGMQTAVVPSNRRRTRDDEDDKAYKGQRASIC